MASCSWLERLAWWSGVVERRLEGCPRFCLPVAEEEEELDVDGVGRVLVSGDECGGGGGVFFFCCWF